MLNDLVTGLYSTGYGHIPRDLYNYIPKRRNLEAWSNPKKYKLHVQSVDNVNNMVTLAHTGYYRITLPYVLGKRFGYV